MRERSSYATSFAPAISFHIRKYSQTQWLMISAGKRWRLYETVAADGQSVLTTPSYPLAYLP